MKGYMILFPILFFTPMANSQSVLKTIKRLPDTGQTIKYTTTYGEDADYTINPPIYHLNGDGTITDTVTGLMWQSKDGGEMTIESASQYCDTLALGGYNDWRMPNCLELFSILNHDKVNPAEDTAYFTLSQAEYWWSSQRQINDSTKVWVTNAGGGEGNHPKSETISAGGSKRFHVRAVRDISPPQIIRQRFVDNGNGTITDSLTNLVWQKNPLMDSLTWEEALTYADTLNYAGKTGWRLPNIKELQSITDEGFIAPSINTALFPSIVTGHYWSSTSLPNQTSKAWYWDTQFGLTTYAAKTGKLYAVCVRNHDIAAAVDERPVSNNKISTYPNPSNGKFTLSSQKIMSQIIIIDLLGNVVYRASPKTVEATIELAHNGIYFLIVEVNGDRATQLISIAK